MVKYCQDNGIVVGVVLFDPWSGWDDSQLPKLPRRSPWYQTNNYSNSYKQGIAFTDPTYFVMSDNVNANPGAATIDTNASNRWLRDLQITLMKRTVDELKTLKNFYWVLANEPDIDGHAYNKQLITWHKYMARQLRTYENGVSAGKHHLIAANVSTNNDNNPGVTDVITSLRQDPNIEIISSHYVRLLHNVGPVNQGDRYGGMQLLRKWNDYEDQGQAKGFNNRHWGLSEDQASGETGFDDQWTADNVRVEAWEYLLNGGALFDHLSYRWANTSGNEPQAVLARQYLGYLGRFMNTFSLVGMKRMVVSSTNQPYRWIYSPPTYGSPFWAAMANSKTYLFYAHRSSYKNLKFDAYQANTTSATTRISIKVQKLATLGCYQADWYYPKGEVIDGGGVNGTILISAQKERFNFTAGSSKVLLSPNYRQDVVLKLNWVQAGSCP